MFNNIMKIATAFGFIGTTLWQHGGYSAMEFNNLKPSGKLGYYMFTIGVCGFATGMIGDVVNTFIEERRKAQKANEDLMKTIEIAKEVNIWS